MAHRKIQLLVVLFAASTSVGYARAPEKIIDGESASIFEFPYQVFIEIRIRVGLMVCGGTIIDTRHILTAAHCCYYGVSLIPPETFTIITGTHDLQYRPTENLFGVLKVTPHPDFDSSDLGRNDIAILKLNRPILFNDRRKPAELPTEDVAESTKVTLTGWGKRAIDYTGFPEPYLQKLRTNIISLTKCAQEVFPRKLQSTQVCTSSESRAVPCKGDSGGPLSVNDVVVGIYSRGTCSSGHPAIFTRVYSYLPWIRSIQAQAIHYSRFLSSVIGR